ncbi:MAG: ComEC/Rec2 family competence protein [Candidatus Firestonebacteria bacterium]
MEKDRLTGLTEIFRKRIEARPLFFSALFYIFGVLFSSSFGAMPLLLSLSALAALSAIYLLTRINKLAIFFALSFFAALAVFSFQEAGYSKNHIRRLVANFEGKKVIMTGWVSGEVNFNPERGTTSAVVNVERIVSGNEEIKTTGAVKVSLNKQLMRGELKYGDRVRIFCRVYPPKAARNPGEFDYAKYLARKGIYALASVRLENLDDFTITGAKKTNVFISAAMSVKKRMLEIIDASLPGKPVHAALLAGMLIGEDDMLPSAISRQFRETGSFHILAVSGFNVALVSAAIFFLLRLCRASKRTAARLSIPAIIFFCLITGSSPSVVRATIMACLYLLSIALERDADIYNVMGLSCLIVLALNPLDIYDIGFQLSYIATFGIVFLVPRFQKALAFMPGWLAGAISVTLSAQLFVLPVLAYYFYYISVSSLLVNILISPMVWAGTVIGFAQVLLGFISIELAKLPAFFVSLSMSSMLWIVEFFSKLSFSVVHVAQPHFYTLLVYYLLIVLALYFKRLVKESPYYLLAGLLVFNISLLYYVTQKTARLETGLLSLDHAQLKLVSYGKGFTLLSASGKASEYEMERIILPYLYSSGINEVSALICSKGFEPLAGKIKCGRVLPLNQSREKNLEITAGKKFKIYIMKDLSVAGKYGKEEFAISGDSVFYGAEKRRIKFKDVKATEAKIVYTYGDGWFEKKW